MGCSRGRHGGRSSGTEFEWFQQRKFEQFQQWIIRWRWWWRMVGVPSANSPKFRFLFLLDSTSGETLRLSGKGGLCNWTPQTPPGPEGSNGSRSSNVTQYPPCLTQR
jgi:hypothetical protein